MDDTERDFLHLCGWPEQCSSLLPGVTTTSSSRSSTQDTLLILSFNRRDASCSCVIN